MRFLILLALALSACARSDIELAAKPVTAPLKVPLVLATEAPTPDMLALTGELVADQRSQIVGALRRHRSVLDRGAEELGLVDLPLEEH